MMRLISSLPRMVTLKSKTLSPARQVYVPLSDSLVETTVKVLLVPSASILTLMLDCISNPSLYHWTTPSALDTSHDRTNCSFSTTLVKRSFSGISTNVNGSAAKTRQKEC